MSCPLEKDVGKTNTNRDSPPTTLAAHCADLHDGVIHLWQVSQIADSEKRTPLVKEVFAVLEGKIAQFKSQLDFEEKMGETASVKGAIRRRHPM